MEPLEEKEKNREETARLSVQVDKFEKQWDKTADEFKYSYHPVGDKTVNFTLEGIKYIKMEGFGNSFWLQRKDLEKVLAVLKPSPMKEAIERD